MILTRLENVQERRFYPLAIRRAIEWLEERDCASMTPGVYEIQGKDIFAQVFDAETEPLSARKPESHREYLDVQYLVSGRERLGVARLSPDDKASEFFPERDLLFYPDAVRETFYDAWPGCISVFFPEDKHRPQVVAGEAPEKVRKVVVKVRLSLLAADDTKGGKA